MAIEFKEGRCYLAMWYAETPAQQMPPNGGNLMVCAWRNENKPTTWTIQYRFRYYMDESIGEHTNDRFSWYEAVAEGITEAQVIEKIAFMFGVSQIVTGEEVDIFWIKGDHIKWGELAHDPATKPKWLHLTKTEEKAA